VQLLLEVALPVHPQVLRIWKILLISRSTLPWCRKTFGAVTFEKFTSVGEEVSCAVAGDSHQ